MSLHNFFDHLNRGNLPASGEAFWVPSLAAHLFAWGTTVPTNDTAGYAPGCMFVHTDGGDETAFYINEGTALLCDFNVTGNAAGSISVADSGSLLTGTTVEAALAEIAQHIQSVQAYLNIPIGAWAEQDGTALADFGDAASPTPGWSAADETFGVRWNNHANPDPISTSVPIPPDLNASADVVVHILCAKTGATAGDTINWTLEAFNNVSGAAYDADADFGGEAAAITGDATAKTVQESTITLAAANVAAAPCILTLTLQPKDGELQTDDVILLGVWLEYTRKTLTS